jgi:hypothetical protein
VLFEKIIPNKKGESKMDLISKLEKELTQARKAMERVFETTSSLSGYLLNKGDVETAFNLNKCLVSISNINVFLKILGQLINSIEKEKKNHAVH